MPKNNQNTPQTAWIPFSVSIKLMFTRQSLFLWSALLVCLTIGITWLGVCLLLDYIDALSSRFFPAAPEATGIWGWIKHAGWVAGNWLYLIISRIISFYLVFLLAYTITTPGYAFLGAAAEKIHAGEFFDEDAEYPKLIQDILTESKKLNKQSLESLLTIIKNMK